MDVGWSPERPGGSGRQPVASRAQVVHGHKPGDQYVRLVVHRHHRVTRAIRHALHLLLGVVF
jgi:hypothetical protein